MSKSFKIFLENKESSEALAKALSEFETQDYQNRDEAGRSPRSGVADSLEVWNNIQNGEVSIQALFKNTDERTAKSWLNRWVQSNVDSSLTQGFTKSDDSWQDGDYQDDWVYASVKFTPKEAE